MLIKSGLILFSLTVLQVSAKYQNVEPDFNDNKFKSDSAAVSSASLQLVPGWEAQPGQHPYHAALRFVNTVGVIRQCGGSIVSKEWIITGASCTRRNVLAIVRAGGVSVTKPEYSFESTEWYNHPTYNNLSGSTQENAISLLKLQRPLVYTRLVKPIRVQSSADAFRDYDGEQVYTIGHAFVDLGPSSDVLRWVYLRAVPFNECRIIYGSSIFNTKICAQYITVTSQFNCIHETGSPLVHIGNDDIPTLIGVTHAYSNIRCRVGNVTGFIRPGAFLPWFKEVTGIDFENIQ